MSAMRAWMAAAWLLVASGVPALALEERTFGQWTLRCSQQECVLSAGSDNGDGVFVRRATQQDAPVAFGLRLRALSPDLSLPLVLRVDGGPKLSFHPGEQFGLYGSEDDIYLTKPGLAGRILAAMRGGAHLRVFAASTGAESEATFPLDGFADALNALASAGGTSTQELRIDAPDLAPADRALSPPVAGGIGARGLPAMLIARHEAQSDCEDLTSGQVAQAEPIVGRLSATASLYALPCAVSDGDTTYRLYVLETGEIGGIQTLYFARHDAAFGWTGTDTLKNVRFDAQTATLTSLSTGRTQTDCGHFARWQWRGFAFALIEARRRITCRDSQDPKDWRRVDTSNP